MTDGSKKSDHFGPRGDGCHQGSDGWPCRRCVQETSDRLLAILRNPVCTACNGYYGSSHGQPVCPTCHAFLYANDLDGELNAQLLSEERREQDCQDSDRDSGNEEPDYAGAAVAAGVAPQQPPEQMQEQRESPLPFNQADIGEDMLFASSDGDPPGPEDRRQRHVRVESLSERLALLTLPRADERPLEQNAIVDAIPPEVLEIIFSFLDDISLYAMGKTCRRWNQHTRALAWRPRTRLRWPLFRPLTNVSDWFSTYSRLVESCFCLTCIYQMAEIIPEDINRFPSREKRVGSELRGLMFDPPEGIKAQPLDSSYYHWQATICGPVSSPYEGGLFYLYMKVPLYYPFYPPEVRFLTRILHPNISRHGDVGIDLILQHNWSCGMTLSKVLISIQSLLTDPFTKVCMEPEVGRIHDINRKMFDAVARKWTYRYAMSDIDIKSPEK